MDSPEHEILDLTAVDESAVKMEDSSNYYEMEVSPNLIGTIRLTVTPAHPGPVVIDITVPPRYHSGQSVHRQRSSVPIGDPHVEDPIASGTRKNITLLSHDGDIPPYMSYGTAAVTPNNENMPSLPPLITTISGAPSREGQASPNSSGSHTTYFTPSLRIPTDAPCPDGPQPVPYLTQFPGTPDDHQLAWDPFYRQILLYLRRNHRFYQ